MIKKIVLFSLTALMLPAIGSATFLDCLDLFQVTLTDSVDNSYRVLKGTNPGGAGEMASFSCSAAQGIPAVTVQNGENVGIRFQAEFVKGAMGASMCVVEIHRIEDLSLVVGPVMADLSGGDASQWKRFLKGEGCEAVAAQVP